MTIRSVLLGVVALSMISISAPAATLTIATLSSMPGFVSGGDALVEINGAGAQKVHVMLNGRDVSVQFHADSARGGLVGWIGGLKLGPNTLTAKAGSQSAKLELVNHPITGPILSGEHLSPFVCKTEESGLGKPLDADCSAATKIEYFYKSTDGGFKPYVDHDKRIIPADLSKTTTTEGKTVPYIVLVESGTINRSIYRIAILDDFDHADDGVFKPSPGWNHRILYSFGGGCGAGYNQGTLAATAVLNDLALSRGLAFITSTQNVLQLHCNDAISGEALMMIKEHFIKRYGVPEWTMGIGGSGGSIQQLLIAQNYPGLLDGLLPSLTFPDSASLAPDVNECTLLENYAQKAGWSKDKAAAVEGYSAGTCGAWVRSFAATIIANNVKGCGIAPELVFDPVKNPKGARCTTYDTNVGSYGRDPATGYARWPLDNVGVQYGLKALNDGAITKQEFLDLNAKVGGFDHDGNPRAERTVADMAAVRLAYITGRINSAGGGLPGIPILHYRTYNDAMGDIHDRVRDFVVRERLRKATGRFDNEVIWIYPNGKREIGAKVSALAVDTMAAWLDALKKDTTVGHAADKVAKAKPAAAVDGCWTADGTRIDEPAVFGQAGKCNDLYPIHLTPRLVAGTPLTDDVMKCQLKPIDPKDYKVTFTSTEMDGLRTAFAAGVCDYSKPGMMQQPLRGTYQVLPLREAMSSRSTGGSDR
jgi:hypothetical protein